MKVYKLVLNEVVTAPGKPMEFIPVLVEHYLSRDAANQKKSEALEGLARILGSRGKYTVDIQEIDVKE